MTCSAQAMRKRYGLVGSNVVHSPSKEIHALLGDYPYDLYSLQEEGLDAFLHQPDIGGLNVTMPFKRAVLAYCDVLTDDAKRAGSVNTLLYGAQGGITGHNTDIAGLRYCANEAGIRLRGRKIMILGTGGAARAAVAVAVESGVRNIVMLSRSADADVPKGCKAAVYDSIHTHADADVLINATPVGMRPTLGECPIDISAFSSLKGVIDMVYDPLRTRLILEAQRRRIPCTGGLPMLIEQARAAACLFMGSEISPQKSDELLRYFEGKRANIVLVGMPGCGKSVIGSALAAMTNRPFFDTDALIFNKFGMDARSIIVREGEAKFRAYEKEIVRDSTGRMGAVISTGGGTPLDEENRLMLRQNGYVIHVQREIALLATGGRPLSRDLEGMYCGRMSVYHACADASICNDTTVEDAAQVCLAVFKDMPLLLRSK